jgi:hypothetical protein
MANSGIAVREMTQEQAGARENLLSERVPEWTTTGGTARSSLPKMTIQTVENRLDWPVECDAGSARPVGQMLSRSKMSASRELRVPVLTQLLCEARNEGPGRSASKIANPPGALEKLGEHDVLLSKRTPR